MDDKPSTSDALDAAQLLVFSQTRRRVQRALELITKRPKRKCVVAVLELLLEGSGQYRTPEAS